MDIFGGIGCELLGLWNDRKRWPIVCFHGTTSRDVRFLYLDVGGIIG